MEARDLLVAETALGEGSGSEALADNVDARRKLAKDPRRLGLLEVERDRSLSRVEVDEPVFRSVARQRRGWVPSTGGPIDAHDVGTEIREQLGRIEARLAREIEDSITFERAGHRLLPIPGPIE